MRRGSHVHTGGTQISLAQARRLVRPPAVRLGVPRPPIHPVLVTVAFVLYDFAASNGEEESWLDTREVESKGLLGPLRPVTSEDQLDG